MAPLAQGEWLPSGARSEFLERGGGFAFILMLAHLESQSQGTLVSGGVLFRMGLLPIECGSAAGLFGRIIAPSGQPAR